MKYSDDLTSEICTYLQNGSSREDVVDLVGVDRSTFYTWMKERLEFSDAVKKAEQICKTRNIQIIQKAAVNVWQAAAWWLERKYPNEFGLKMRPPDDRNDEVPQRMAERAKELLDKLEKKGVPPVGNTNGNGVHP